MATTDRTIAMETEAARILTARGSNQATLPNGIVTVQSYPPTPLSPVIQVLGAPDGATEPRHRSPVQGQGSSVKEQHNFARYRRRRGRRRLRRASYYNNVLGCWMVTS